MTTRDYHVLHWSSAMDGAWSPEAARRYRDNGYDGLVVVPGGAWKPSDLEFLRELPGLRSFSYAGRLQKDTAAFAVETMEVLSLATGSRRSLPDVVQPHLQRATLTDRPGLDVARRWPALRELRLGTWRGVDFEPLRGAAVLNHLKVEGRRQGGGLSGLEACPSLKALTSINYSIADTAPLRPLTALTEVKLLAADPTPAHGTIDLADLRSPELSVVWISNASTIANVAHLSTRERLREVRLLDCRVSDEDRNHLAALPSWVKVELR